MREIRLNAKEHSRFLEVMEQKMSEQDLSIEDLAERIGVKKQSIYNFRTDTSRNPSKFLAAKIANLLGLTPKDWR
jgi:DNA-binding XRE family transcriptional regulator